MRKCVPFEEFISVCPHFQIGNDGYGICKHPLNRDSSEYRTINGKKKAFCLPYHCPKGIEAEEEDFIGGDSSVKDWSEINWNGYTQKEIACGGFLLVDEQKENIQSL